MTDTVDRATRSRIMARIRSEDTGPELGLRRALWRRGLRGYRLHVRGLPGTPDVVFRRARLAVFVDGEFWHGRAGVPKTRRRWWLDKFAANRERDERADRELTAAGWTVLRLSARALGDGAGADAAALLVKAILMGPDPRAAEFARWLVGVSLHRIAAP